MQEMFPVSASSTAEMVRMLVMSRRFSPPERTFSSTITLWGQKEEIKSDFKLLLLPQSRKTPKVPRTDRLGGVFPGDVVVEVGVVRGAENLELLSNNAHIFICLQEDVWREAKL